MGKSVNQFELLNLGKQTWSLGVSLLACLLVGVSVAALNPLLLAIKILKFDLDLLLRWRK